MSLDSVLNVIFFVVGLGIGLLQLYIAQHQFEVQQREKMDELRKILTEIQQRLAVIEGVTSDRVFAVQDKLIHLIAGEQAVVEFTEDASKKIQALVEAELRASGIQDSLQRTNSLEQKLAQILARSAESLVDQAFASDPLGLTNRERVTLKLLDQGKNRDQIAETLTLSIRTVQFHVNNLCQKFRVRDTAGLIQAYHASQSRPEAT